LEITRRREKFFVNIFFFRRLRRRRARFIEELLEKGAIAPIIDCSEVTKFRFNFPPNKAAAPRGFCNYKEASA
jgi:hypothetical protein